MATPPSDDTRVMFRLLKDGGWHNYAGVKASIAAQVPPGRALRKYQMRLRQNRDLRNDPNTDIYRSEDDQVRLGQGACAQITMTSWIGKGIITRGEGQDREVKIKPGFKPWGIEVGPEPQEPPPEPQGYTDPPPSDSEPSVPAADTAQEASVPEPEPVPVPQPEPEKAPEPEPVMPQLLSDVIDPPPAAGEPDVPAPGFQRPKVDDFVRDLPQGPEPSSQYVANVPVWGCPECFLAVTDEAAHAKWHQELKADQSAEEFALVDREAMVTLIGDVTRQVLDEFQTGMQDWLEARFAELERQIFALRGVRPDRVSWAQKP